MSAGFFFYKYVSVQDALLIIKNGTLFFTNPMNFNDPFDIAPAFPKEGLNKNYKMVLNYHGIKPQPYGKKRKEVLKKVFREPIREGFLKEWSVTCFSSSPFILPLWAHYANNHKGCVLEFKVTEEINDHIVSGLDKNHMDDEVIYPLSVVYSKKRPRSHDVQGNITEKMAQQMILTKDEAWSYEKELRSFKNKPQGAYPFRKDQLNRVYCGLKIECADKNKIIEAVRDYRDKHGHLVKIDDVHLDREEYRMTKL
ncbi:DUF2971 domain-containing protein [Cronobacter dublinensis]|uniref:DUF2971 domain-containing protein n=1 Tax=Cronobacter dublinensis TaxID=413497 RepID=UPI0024C43FC8|nr:DUF2971 domain-containing protein [Cronobacter dublinensis]MDK1192617.1 DUF2971 domain-containing protein [Cronobacter dublinensis]MDK1201076.1 DUF2971 domain-containing protein [Cronobacter dublinensis]